MTDIDSLLAEPVTGPLSQSDSLLWIRMRAALAEAMNDVNGYRHQKAALIAERDEARNALAEAQNDLAQLRSDNTWLREAKWKAESAEHEAKQERDAARSELSAFYAATQGYTEGTPAEVFERQRQEIERLNKLVHRACAVVPNSWLTVSERHQFAEIKLASNGAKP